MRLFVSIAAPEHWRGAATRVQRAFPPDLRRTLRLVEPAMMHVTIRFLGEVPDGRVPSLVEALRAHVPPVEVPLVLGGPGTFGPPNRTAAVYLHILGDRDALEALRDHVDRAVRDALGRGPEERGFTPHLTLGRLGRRATPADRRAVAAAVRDLPAVGLDVPGGSSAALPGALDYTARSVALVRSHLGSGGARYQDVEEIG